MFPSGVFSGNDYFVQKLTKCTKVEFEYDSKVYKRTKKIHLLALFANKYIIFNDLGGIFFIKRLQPSVLNRQSTIFFKQDLV